MFEYCRILFIILLLTVTSKVRAQALLYELSDEEKQQLLDAHNGYRRDAVRRFGASDMCALEWSETLATVATYHAMACHLTNDQDGLTIQEYTSIGENLAKTLIFSGTEIVHGFINFTQLVGYWYSQHTYYNVTDNTCTISCKEFLQVVWADTFAVGCGTSICDDVYPRAIFLCCNYGPTADTSLSTRPFQLGAACSKCPVSKRHCENDLCSVAEDTAIVGSDPHFSVLLPTGGLLCYTVQGQANSFFSLISNEHLSMNALFVPDPNPAFKVRTWLGQIGITVKGVDKHIQLVFTASTSEVTVNKKISIPSSTVEKLSFRTGKLVMMETKQTRHPRIYIEYDDAGLHLSIVFVNDHHLDLIWHSTSKITGKSGGLIGQFLDSDIEIDENEKVLLIPGQDPIPVMKRQVWKFVKNNLESDGNDDNLSFCWTTVYPGYQGHGIIRGTFLEYKVQHILAV